MEQGSATQKYIPELDGPIPPVPAVPELAPLVLDIEKLKFIETESSTDDLIKTAGALVVTTADQYTAADEFLGKVRKARNGVKARIAAFLDKNIKKAKELHQSLCDDRTAQQTEHDLPLEKIETRVIALMRKYEEDVRIENKRLADLAEAKRKEDLRIATKKAEDDRKEQLRIDNEKKQAEATKLAEQKTAQEAEARKLAEAGQAEAAAEALRKAGESGRQAAAVLAAPPPPAPAFIPAPPSVEPMAGYGSRGGCGSVVPKSKALGGRKDYEWKGTNKMALILAAAKNPEAFADFLDFNDATLTARAKALKEKAGKTNSGENFPGVEFTEKIINSIRGGK